MHLINLIVDIFVIANLVSGLTNESVHLSYVQIMFRHGDRAPLTPMLPNDPYSDENRYWPHGLEQLTSTGRVRMYRLGEVIRNRYNQYLGDRFSPREVYVRSSAIDRCLESAQLVLAAAYPPNSSLTKWAIENYSIPLSELWQPIPIVTFIPPDDDVLLRVEKPCPRAERERNQVMNSPENRKLMEENKLLIQQLANISGYELNTVKDVSKLHENLKIEHTHGYYWYKTNVVANWTKEYEDNLLNKLREFDLARWNSEETTMFLKRTKAGDLLTTIGNNFNTERSVLTIESERTRLILYSTHDSKLAAVLHALDLWNNQFVPYSAAIMFEMYKNNSAPDDFYVQIWYLNETESLLTSPNDPKPYLLRLPTCNEVMIEDEPMCPLDDFLIIMNRYMAPIDWLVECEMETENINIVLMNILLLFVNLTIMFVLLIVLMYYCNRLSNKEGYQQL